MLGKARDKESVAVLREPGKAELTQRDLANSDEYLHFTQPLFKLLSSQDEPQQEEIHGEEVKVVGPVKEPSSQEFEEIVYTQGMLDRLDKEMNDVQMKIAEKKLERILKLREELRELENVETPQKPETSRMQIYNWATQCTNTNQYEFLFNFKTGKSYQAMRDHFMSLDREAEMDLVNGMLAAYNHNYFDPEIERPYSIRTLTENDNNEGLHYIDRDKMRRAHYLFAPVFYGSHWWLYVIQVKGKKFYVLDSKNIKNPSGERMKLNRFAEQLEEFREQIVERILCDVDNEFREMVMQVANPHARHPRPSRALQSRYIQLDSGDLTSK
ncbi:hypothetical protein PIB30_066339 [Stylosanthes scabra]|uniref:Ubiquitin-like protease family profile domain-containing protein n=1 Tax=Stylosanthes scabra TaxID=79078 RepID=A0ABU6SMT6_9FABA|nr:hypothetical protein [Stylosanthes scabra]